MPQTSSALRRGGAGIRVVAVLIAVAIVAAIIALVVAVQPKDGDRIAEQAVTDTAEAVRSVLDRPGEAASAEEIAATRLDGYSSTVTPVRWSGSTQPDKTATIDVRVRVNVDAQPATSVFGASNSAGSAEGCFRYTLRQVETTTSAVVDCGTLPADVDPPNAPPPAELPEEAPAQIRAALSEEGISTAADLTNGLRSAFPEPRITIDATITSSGDRVAAVGVPQKRRCVVVVRHADGTFTEPAVDRTQLEPGEVGCSTGLYPGS